MTSRNECIIVDAGTGLREWEHNQNQSHKMPKEYHIFLSHFHYDHLLGLPYFSPIYNSDVSIHFYSPYSTMEHVLRHFINPPYHPISWENLKADIQCHVLKENDSIKLKNLDIEWIARKTSQWLIFL